MVATDVHEANHQSFDMALHWRGIERRDANDIDIHSATRRLDFKPPQLKKAEWQARTCKYLKIGNSGAQHTRVWGRDFQIGVYCG